MNTYIGYTLDSDLRYRASSGGVGSAIVRYLFTSGAAASALSFDYNSAELKYEPRVIFDWESYKASGSIYHAVDFVTFVKDNLVSIRSPFVCFALPCQVSALRAVLDGRGVESYIIEMTCSSQQSIDATRYLLKRIAVKQKDVHSIRYRGNGWPSGIEVLTNSGRRQFIPNSGSVWEHIFHSRLFCLPQCFLCNPDRESVADITIADPWRIDTPSEGAQGRTLFVVRSEKMESVVSQMEREGVLFREQQAGDMLSYSQHETIMKKRAMLHSRAKAVSMRNLYSNRFYRWLVLSSPLFFYLHHKRNRKSNRVLRRRLEKNKNK